MHCNNGMSPRQNPILMPLVSKYSCIFDQPLFSLESSTADPQWFVKTGVKQVHIPDNSSGYNGLCGTDLLQDESASSVWYDRCLVSQARDKYREAHLYSDCCLSPHNVTAWPFNLLHLGQQLSHCETPWNLSWSLYLFITQHNRHAGRSLSPPTVWPGLAWPGLSADMFKDKHPLWLISNSVCTAVYWVKHSLSDNLLDGLFVCLLVFFCFF